LQNVSIQRFGHVFADPYGELLFDGIVTCESIAIGPESDSLL
jgi:hypothetical protein